MANPHADSDSRTGLCGRALAGIHFALRMLCLCILAPAAAYALAPEDIEQESAIFALEAPRVRIMLEQASAKETGRGQPPNLTRAATLYCKAAAYGSLEAQYRLGRLYLEGRGLAKDIAIAATLFRSAAGNGHEGAKAMLLLTGEQEERLPECLAAPDDSSAPLLQNLFPRISGNFNRPKDPPVAALSGAKAGFHPSQRNQDKWMLAISTPMRLIA
jgi:TPR repeat protein